MTNENPPEKFVRYLAKYEYKIELNITYDEERDPEFVAAVQNNEERKMSLTSTDTEHNSEAKAESAAKDVANNDSDESD